MTRHQINPVLTLETILNLTYLIYYRYKNIKFGKVTANILNKFCEEEILDQDQLIAWSNKDTKIMNFLKQHPLYEPELDECFRRDTKDFIEYL